MARFYGYEPDPDGTDLIVSGLPYPTLAEAGPRLQASTKEALLYPALLACSPDWRRGAQGIGSCVGWGWAHCVDVLAAVEIAIHGEREEWAGRVLEASVYAFSRCEARGVKRAAGYQDGSYGAAAAKAVSEHGTLHYGIDYGNERFESYDPKREKEWGNLGVPDELEPWAKKRCVKTVTLVRNFDEAALALQSGYPIAVCSGQGFVFTRDNMGFCKTRSSWSHCMAFVGARFDRPGLLCVNSWGDSNTGEHYPKNMPEAVKKCSFWVDADVATYMLRGGDSFALSSYDGFPPRKLPDWGFKGVL